MAACGTTRRFILEAGAAGIPVVASDVGACRELIEGRSEEDQRLGPSGIVTRFAAPEETAAAIARLARDRELRRRMGAAACRLAAAVGYVNAGTAEFLVDAHGSFYFLEMNARLQVEHPVTELVTGRDLVREQLRIAAGEKLGYGQEDIAWSGAAIECRINAEDPDQGFLPSPGCITRLSAPAGPWVRNDSGVYAGYTVPRYYDTLMAKLIVWAPDREAAVARMERALGEYQVGGVRSTIPVLRRILRHPDFVAGKLDTQFMERLDDAPVPGRHRTVALIAAALAAYERAGRETPPAAAPTVIAWARLGRPGSSGLRPR